MAFPKISVQRVVRNTRFTESVQILRNYNTPEQLAIDILCSIQPADATTMNVLEKYNYKNGGIRLWTDNFPLYLETEDNPADLVLWQDKLYRVVQEYDWSQYANSKGHFKYIAGLINQALTNTEQSEDEDDLPQLNDMWKYPGRRD